YDVHHTFSIMTNTPTVPNVSWLAFDHAWVIQNAGTAQFQVSPASQPPAFNNYGLDVADSAGRVTNNGVPVVNSSTTVPAGGLTASQSVSIPALPSSASASSRIQINPLVLGSPITGVIGSSGAAENTGPVSDMACAWAFSHSDLRLQGDNKLAAGCIG